jgi:hypothetical protein
MGLVEVLVWSFLKSIDEVIFDEYEQMKTNSQHSQQCFVFVVVAGSLQDVGREGMDNETIGKFM